MMKLNDKDFKRFKELSTKAKQGKLTATEKKELDALTEKKNADRAPKDEFKPGNDFEWWNKIPELIKDCANFKCNWIPGTAIAPGVVADTGIGVLRVDVDTLAGCSVAATDPVNTWARDLYLRMFQKYRPASGYTASDLGIALLAGYEAVKLIALYERIYGVINRYSRLNVNMPLVEAQAMGLSAADVSYLQGHMSDFRYDLNFLIRKAQRLCIPKDMSVLADAISLFGYEYMDHESVRSQIIIFMPNEYGVYSDTAMESGGSIEHKNYTSIFDFNADNMCKLLVEVLNALIGSDSIQRIFADLVVWFGSEAMLQFVAVPEDYMIIPVHSESILHKLHNLETISDPNYRLCSWVDNLLSTNDIATVTGTHFTYQCDDRIITAVSKSYLPTGASGGTNSYAIHGVAGSIYGTTAGLPAALTLGHVIDTAHNDITPEIIVEGAMYKEFDIPVALSGYSCLQVESGSFYCVRSMTLYTTVASINNIVTVSATLNTALTAAARLACVDWAPLAYFVNATNVVQALLGDYDNIVYVSNPDLSRIQRTVVLSGLETNAQVVNK